MTVAAVADLTARLFQFYARSAWPFALLHLVVIFYLGRSVLRMLRETRELRLWQPTSGSGEGPAAILTSFIVDSEGLGQRGFVVPITDYSDRLDAEVENLVDEIGDRTNMLLLVGIAGTLFGVFEFAARTSSLGDDRMTQIGPILAESMAKAFPVGFVGLLLMLVFQLALGWPISRLHRAASDATRRALEHRGVVSRTLADAVAVSIAESMKPISTLGATMSEHLQPVVTSLGERLEQSLSLVKLQFGEIDQSTQRFIKATSNLHQSTNALTNTSERLGELLKSTPKVLAQTEKIQQLHQGVLEQLDASFRRNLEVASEVAHSLQDVRAAAEGLPQELVRQAADAMRPALEGLVTAAINQWDALVQKIGGEIEEEYAALVSHTRTQMQEVQAAVAAAAAEWQRIATGSEALIAQPMEAAMSGVSASAERVATLAAELARSLEIAQNGLASLPERIAERTSEAILPAFDRVANESSRTWTELIGVLVRDVQRDYGDLVNSNRRELEAANAEMRAASEQMRRLAEGAQASLTEPLKTAIETVRREASGALAEVDAFVRERYPAIREDMAAFGAQMTMIIDSLKALDTRIKAMSGGALAPAAPPANDMAEALNRILAFLEKQEKPPAPPRTIRLRVLQWLGIRK